MRGGSQRWLARQARDPYVRKAKADNYRSRAAYKLQELDQRYRLFSAGDVVCDLGAAPGSWSQYAARRCGPGGLIIAVDAVIMAPLEHVRFIHGDFATDRTRNACYDALAGRSADLVISDMSPNMTGIRDTDQAAALALAEQALAFARQGLKQGGKLLVKLFEGVGIADYRVELSKDFQRLVSCKPEASRSQSREIYMLASGYRL